MKDKMGKRHGYTNITGDINFDGLNPKKYKSQLERDAFIYWMMEPGVARIQIEPGPKKKYVIDGEEHDYTPDLHVAFLPSAARNPFYVECKYSDQLDKLKRKHDCIKATMEAAGQIFIIQTENDIYNESFPARRFLLFARDEPRDPEMEAEILAELAKTGEVEVGELIKRLRKSECHQLAIVPQVWRLAGLGRIMVRSSTLLGKSTVVGPATS